MASCQVWDPKSNKSHAGLEGNSSENDIQQKAREAGGTGRGDAVNQALSRQAGRQGL